MLGLVAVCTPPTHPPPALHLVGLTCCPNPALCTVRARWPKIPWMEKDCFGIAQCPGIQPLQCVNVAYSLLRQPRGHNKARVRKASGRRARSPDRPIGRSTNRSTDRSIRFNASLWIRFSTGSNVAYRPAKGEQQSEDSERLRSPQISDAAL